MCSKPVAVVTIYYLWPRQFEMLWQPGPARRSFILNLVPNSGG